MDAGDSTPSVRRLPARAGARPKIVGLGESPAFGETAAALRVCSAIVSKIQSIPFVAAAIALAAVLPLSSPIAQADDGAATLADVHQLKPGDKGYGLTVFSGTTPERFDVEVIGVLDNFLPSQDLVLVKTFHPRLQVAKVVAGMSGSPVFIGGKMIGAYAYGWQFGEESVAGVTPISSMLNELKRPIPRELLLPLPHAAPSQTGRRAHAAEPSGLRFAGSPIDYALRAHAEQVAAVARPSGSLPSGATIQPVATPLMVGGVSESSLALMRESLAPMGIEPMQGGGGGRVEPDAPQRFVDGGAIGVQLIRGDISASGIGTVTRVSGNRLLAFGHPMMNAGVSRLPTAIAKVQWILASKMRSFKIGTPVRPLGALINDRQAAIVVDSTVEAPMIPLTVDVRGVPGAPHPKWTMDVAHERFMAPMFLAVAMGNALEATTQERRDVSWHAYTKIRVRGYGEFTMHDFGVAVGGTPSAGSFMRSRAVSAIGALLSNPWEDVDIEGVDMRIDVRFARDLLMLRGAEPVEPEIDAGRKARIRIQLIPYAGPPQTRIIEVDIPRELAGKTIEIKLDPGHQEAPPVAKPENVTDLIAALPQLTYAPDVIVASVRVGGQGVAYKGQVATRLPPGALDTLRPQSSSIAPEPVPSYARTFIPLNQFVVGSTSVQIRVRQVLR